MSEIRACPECGASLPPDAPRGLCPRCLMGAAFSATATHRPAGSPSGTGTPAGPPVDFAEFRPAVLETGLVDAEEFERFAAGAAGDVARTARELVRAGKLTAYQAGALAQGKGRGLVIGPYLVLDKLGQGGMGVVFKARHRRDGRVLALKILPPSFGRDREAVLRFRREFEVAARLSHPNVVAAIDADEDRGVQFLTMDFIDGQDLDVLVNAVGPLPIKLAINCAIQAATGLAAAHGQGIIHRDIKPANLMLDASGVVRVLDLGLARVVAATNPLGRSSGTSLTQSGATMGTVDFMAPEQADDSKKADLRADIYSLGCTLHFLLTGRPPFEGDSALKRLMAHQNQPAPSLHASRDDVLAPLEAAYQTMMAKRPGDRPRSMTEVIELLESCRSTSDEARDARAGLKKAFAETVMNRAAPRGKERGRNASIFARPSADDGLKFDPDLRFEDVVMDLRPEYHAKPLREDQLPPLLPRLAPPRRGSRRRPAPVALWGVILAVLGAVGYVLWPRSRPAPEVVPSGLPVRAEIPFRPLFNGKDLIGWVPRYSGPKDWPVEGGTLIARGRGTNMMAILTERAYFDFVLRLEYQTSGRADSGFLLAGPEIGGKLWQEEFNIGGVASETGSFQQWGYMGNGQFFPAGPDARFQKGDGSWNALEVERRGGKLSFAINGRKVHDGLDGDSGPRRIGFQAMDGVVRFRNIEIRELPDPLPRPTPSAEDRPVLARLDEPISLEARDVLLGEFLRSVEVATVAPGRPKGLPIVVDSVALQDAGKTAKTPVTVRPRGALKETLAATLEPSGLGFFVRDGTLRITSDFLAARATRPGPSGFASLFNGKDLAGWVPSGSRPEDWAVDGRALVARGRGERGMAIVTNRAYSDFALRFEYRTSGRVDSGVLLTAPERGGNAWKAEFNISNVPDSFYKTGDLLSWDDAGTTHYLPAVSAASSLRGDGSWNAVEVVRRGDTLSLAINGTRVHTGPGAGTGPRRVGFQGMDGDIRFRNIEVRELPPQAPRPAEGTTGPSGFVPLFNGRDLAGWAGDVADYEVRDGAIRARTRKQATIYSPKEYADFAARVEFRLTRGGNGGMAIRYPGSGDPPFTGMCEIEIIDEAEYPGMEPRQHHGSAYGLAAARRGHLRPVGEWNTQEVTVRGSTVKVELNGAVLLDVDLSRIRETMNNEAHRGKDRTFGYFGLTNVNAPVEYRKVEIRDLKGSPAPSSRSGPTLGRVIYADDFSDPATGWERGLIEHSPGFRPFLRDYEKGVYYAEAGPDWYGACAMNCAGPLVEDFQCELVGRILGEGAAAEGGWGLIIPGPDGRGFQAEIDRKGVLTVDPSFWGVEKFPNDPHSGPIRHAAVRRGNEWNTLTLRVRKRRMEVFVNGVPACEPREIDWDLTPANVQLCVYKPDITTRVRAEFDRIEIREIVADAPAGSSPNAKGQ